LAHHRQGRFHRRKVSERLAPSLPALTWVLTVISHLLLRWNLEANTRKAGVSM
jgi:hypothetical protein